MTSESLVAFAHMGRGVMMGSGAGMAGAAGVAMFLTKNTEAG